MPQVKIFSGTSSSYLAEKIAEAYGTKLGDLTISRFSDGEMAPHFNESIRGAEVFLVQSTFPPADNLLELMLMVDAAK
ncbi:MAG: ribose-phosphate pyrophosphokinase-like domain-containing protein, partial [Hymenobacteraceae bacterium]|nr:ribose-phosphate pyrophosphokinase-like domain-containing protein [Hymenobacteraceae bacterium]